MGRGRWRVVEHTAEVALAIEGPDWPAFYEAAGQGLLALYDPPPLPRADESKTVDLEADTPEELLVRWLNELIYLVSAKRWMPARVRVKEADGSRLSAELDGAPLGDGAGVREIKAATFGALAVRADEGGRRATIILDV